MGCSNSSLLVESSPYDWYWRDAGYRKGIDEEVWIMNLCSQKFNVVIAISLWQLCFHLSFFNYSIPVFPWVPIWHRQSVKSSFVFESRSNRGALEPYWDPSTGSIVPHTPVWNLSIVFHSYLIFHADRGNHSGIPSLYNGPIRPNSVRPESCRHRPRRFLYYCCCCCSQKLPCCARLFAIEF